MDAALHEAIEADPVHGIRPRLRQVSVQEMQVSDIAYSRFQEACLKEYSKYLENIARLVCVVGLCIMLLRFPTHPTFAGYAGAFSAVVASLLYSGLLITYTYPASIMFMFSILTCSNELSLAYPDDVVKHRSFMGLYFSISIVCACCPVPRRLYLNCFVPAQIVSWMYFHWYVNLRPTERAVEMGFGLVINVCCVLGHSYWMKRELKLFHSIEIAKAEIGRADGMLATLRAMFDSQYDASAICSESGLIQTASKQLDYILQAKGGVQHHDLCTLAATVDDTQRVQAFLANIKKSEERQVQAMTVTMRTVSGSGTNDLSLYGVRLPTGFDPGTNDFFCIVGFKLVQPEASTVPDVPDVSTAHHSVGCCKDHLYLDSSAIDPRSSLISNQASSNSKRKRSERLPSFAGASSVGSELSKLSRQSFWDAMRLICGVDVAPKSEVRELVAEHSVLSNGGGAELWANVSFEVAKDKLLGDLDYRVQRSHDRVINRERAASCLAAAVVQRQGLGRDDIDESVSSVISNFVGPACLPPLPEDGSKVTSEHVRWLRAYARASGNEDVGALLQFSLLCRRLAMRASDPYSDDTAEEVSSGDSASEGAASEEIDDRQADLEDLVSSAILQQLQFGADT